MLRPMTMRLRRALGLAVTTALLALVSVVWLSASGSSRPQEFECRAKSKPWSGNTGSTTVEVRDGMPVSGFDDLNGAWYGLWSGQHVGRARATPVPLLPATPDGNYEAVVRKAPPSDNLILTVDGNDLYLVPIYCD